MRLDGGMKGGAQVVTMHRHICHFSSCDSYLTMLWLVDTWAPLSLTTPLHTFNDGEGTAQISFRGSSQVAQSPRELAMPYAHNT